MMISLRGGIEPSSDAFRRSGIAVLSSPNRTLKNTKKRNESEEVRQRPSIRIVDTSLSYLLSVQVTFMSLVQNDSPIFAEEKVVLNFR